MALSCVAAVASTLLFVLMCVNIFPLSVNNCFRDEDYTSGGDTRYCRLYLANRSSVIRFSISSLSPVLLDAIGKPKQSWPTGVGRRLRYCKSRVSYCANCDSTFNLPLNSERLLLLSNDIQQNPGPTSTNTSSRSQSGSADNIDVIRHGVGQLNNNINEARRVVTYSAQTLMDLRFCNKSRIDINIINRLTEYRLVNRRIFHQRGKRAGYWEQQRLGRIRDKMGCHLDDSTTPEAGPADSGSGQAGRPIPVIVSQRGTSGRLQTSCAVVGLSAAEAVDRSRDGASSQPARLVSQLYTTIGLSSRPVYGSAATSHLLDQSVPAAGTKSAVSVNKTVNNSADNLHSSRCLINIDLEDSRMPVFLVTNINHVSNKFDELCVLSKLYSPTIIAFTETFLDSSIPDSAVSLANYSITRKDRCSGIGGGVALYIADGVITTACVMLNVMSLKFYG